MHFYFFSLPFYNIQNLQKRLDQLNAAQDNYKKAANEFSMKVIKIMKW